MKKSIKTAMFAFAVVAAGFSGMKAYHAYQVNNMSNSNLLFVENVSALSDNDDPGIPECPGEARWSTSLIGDAETTLRFHVADSLDRCQIVKFKGCYAYGTGKKPGNNMMFWDTEYGNDFYVKCDYRLHQYDIR